MTKIQISGNIHRLPYLVNLSLTGKIRPVRRVISLTIGGVSKLELEAFLG
jgi:hypothetical protein